jgi:transposase
VTNNSDKELYFFDEARFGTHSNLGHGWFPKGTRTAVKVKLGFKNFYVYSAVHISSGKDFSLILPKVNTINMNEFLALLSKEVGDKQIILVMDGAGWHKSKSLVVPSNVEIIYLPPYSPELNPVEKFWQYIKSHVIKNKIYETLDQLEEAVCQFILALNPDSVKLTCSSRHYDV